MSVQLVNKTSPSKRRQNLTWCVFDCWTKTHPHYWQNIWCCGRLNFIFEAELTWTLETLSNLLLKLSNMSTIICFYWLAVMDLLSQKVLLSKKRLVLTIYRKNFGKVGRLWRIEVEMNFGTCWQTNIRNEPGDCSYNFGKKLFEKWRQRLFGTYGKIFCGWWKVWTM